MAACLLPLAVQAYSASVLTRAGAGVSVIGAPGSTEHQPAERSASTTKPEPLNLSNAAYALTTNAQYTASATGHSFASVSPGLVSVFASGQGTGTASPPTYSQSDSTGYGYASGGFADSMTLNVAGVAAGALVWVDFSVRFEGTAGVTRTAVAGGWAQGGNDYHWGLQITSPGWGAGTLYNSGTRTYQVDVNGNVTFNTLQFGAQPMGAWLMTGTPLGLNAWAWAQAFGRGGYSYCPSGCTDQMAGVAYSFMDASHTLAWNGVQGVKLADGSAVDLAGVSLWSETGLNLMQPVTSVPEPMSAVLLALGLSVLYVARRRRA
ncbi:PEP-CTERM sorting domain-containing protein [Roseateles asaccharophilus]|uniref:PEP-CTERM sorting domain-containing protein n=1 Tax=Roseateles asaccharophilus TaxID=582607 RepID=A0ABU2ACR7_9BURK|nr:PEP-CTERM sorting domain-containing protein [Roseateles asaccharophilus]MDR7334997.1 hypothetical protein [Roseateles asaccharophilus]